MAVKLNNSDQYEGCIFTIIQVIIKFSKSDTY